MTTLRRAALLLATLLVPYVAIASTQPDPAQEPTTALAQIFLTGEIGGLGAEAAGGHLVELEITAAASHVMQELVLHLHVAKGTRGVDLVQLAAARLKRLGIGHTVTGVGAGLSSANLWVEDATRVHLRLGAGLTGEVSCTERAPSSIQLLPSSAIQEPLEVHVSASSAIIMKGRAPVRGKQSFSARLEDASNSSEAATALWKAATDTWVSDRPGTSSWRPIKMASGATITGVSVRLTGRSDWGLEVLM